ncbi:MAG TPA: GNAT family N-acetyltransferase [Longimicrobiales bacterium]|nr:GNAT family N-acetyltransferase [Longimicrobiales bacterium]
MDTKIRNNEERHRFETSAAGDVAFANYRLDGDRLVLTHTEVPMEAREQGLATQLAKFAFEYARTEGLKIVPQCGFMADYADKHTEYADIIAEQ